MQIDEEYFKSDEFREILESYEASIDSGSTPFMDADDLVDIADYYNWQGYTDKAEDVIDHALYLYPNATLPNVFKARKALANDDFDGAHKWAEQIEDHDAPDYHYLQAEIMIAEGNIDEADRYLRNYGTTVDDDEYEDFVKDCANLYIDYDESDKAYQWMMRSHGDNSDDFKELMARTLFGLGKYKDSERIFNELIDHHPYSKTYWNALASAQFMNEDYSGSVASSEYAIAIDPEDPEGILSKAHGLLRLGNYEEAYKYFERYTQLVGPDAYCLLNQSVCLISLGRYQESLALLEQAIEAADSSETKVQIYEELAFCYSALRQPDKAMEMLAKTEELPCDHIDIMVVRGHILLENDDVIGAEKAFKQAINESEGNPNVLLRIIVSLYDNHYLNACYRMFKFFLPQIVNADEEWNEGYSYMALCCYDLGKTREFLKYLKLAVDNNPQEAKLVLGFLFPEDMPAEQYYKEAKRQTELRDGK
ncbi:MAG: tetratricopeptide repeat protein [Prevotella sp.]|nr:tetratricopeptide repeat protein [Prevotella sp.]